MAVDNFIVAIKEIYYFKTGKKMRIWVEIFTFLINWVFENVDYNVKLFLLIMMEKL